MDGRALYETILGIARPWEVERVELDDTAKAVHVWLAEQAGSTFTCPDCQTISPLYDHVERNWRHLDTSSTRPDSTPRSRGCAARSTASKRSVPWAVPHSRFTMLFERLAIAWLKEAMPAARWRAA